MYEIIVAQKYLESANKKALLNAIIFYSFILFKFIKCYLKISVRLNIFFCVIFSFALRKANIWIKTYG